MSLSSLQLDAFLAVAQQLSFSRAARTLHITQSALSQRVRNLEDELGLTVFVRDPAGVRLTEEGERLLRYCRIRDGLEGELMQQLGKSAEGSTAEAGLGGALRIAGFSSVTRSVLLPAIAPLLRANPRLRVEIFTRELRDLPGLLARGEADFVATIDAIDRADVESELLGHEELVVVESERHPIREGIWLDHDAEDSTTLDYFRSQGKRAIPGERSFLDDIYGILDGVALGYGRAVVSRHLVRKGEGLRIARGSGKGEKAPVRLSWISAPYYTALHLAARQALLSGCTKFLDGSAAGRA